MPVQNFNPVDHDRFKEVSIKSFFCTPYVLGLENLQHVWDKESSFCGRVFRVITGLLLLIPLLNTITYIVLRQWSEKDPTERFKEDIARILAESHAQAKQEKREYEEKRHREIEVEFNKFELIDLRSPENKKAALFENVKKETQKFENSLVRKALLEDRSINESGSELFHLCEYLLTNENLIKPSELKNYYLNYIKAIKTFIHSLNENPCTNSKLIEQNAHLLNETHAKFIDLTYQEHVSIESLECIKKELSDITDIIKFIYLNKQPFSDDSKKIIKGMFYELARWINTSYSTTYLVTNDPKYAISTAFPHPAVKLKMNTLSREINLEKTPLPESYKKLFKLCKYSTENAELIKSNPLKEPYLNFLKSLQTYLESIIEKQNEKIIESNLFLAKEKHEIFFDLLVNHWNIDTFAKNSITGALIFIESSDMDVASDLKSFLHRIADWINDSFIHVAVTSNEKR